MAAQKPEGGKPLLVIDDMRAPEVFSDWAQYFTIREGVVKITFTSLRTNAATNEQALVVIARLSLSIYGARGLANGLASFLKDNGIDPSLASPLAPPGETLQ